MAKSRGYMYNGRRYSSRRAFIRQMRGMFASLPQAQRKKVRPIIIRDTRPQKKTVQVTGRNWKDVSSTIEKETTLAPKEQKNGSVVLQESNQTYRVSESTYQDPDTKDTIRIATAEEASRYTPSELDYHYEDMGNGVTQVNATKGERIVSSSVTTVSAPQERNEKIFYLEDKFKKWQQDKKVENRLSSKELGILAKELNIPTGGGKLKHYKVTMEKRLKRHFELAKEQQKQDIDTRYRTFPQRTKSHIAHVEGKKYENSAELNALINEALSGKARHERSELEQMELLLSK